MAALLVVLHHLGAAMASPKYFGASSFAVPFRSGDSGVEFFFVLSGFIITWVHYADFGKPALLLTYFRKRAVRIYPTYWIVFMGVYLLALSSSTLRNSVPHDLSTVLKCLALIPQDASVTGGTGALVLIVAWSLQYEICFYILFALCIANRFLGMSIIVALSLNMATCMGTTCSFPRSFLSSNLMLLFGIGALVAYASKSSLRMARPLTLAVMSASAFLLFGAMETVLGQETLWVDRRLIYGIFSAILILALVRSEDSAQLRITNRWVSLLGDASFALYLVHFPLMNALCKLGIAVGLAGVAGAAIAYPLILSACVAAALAFHLTVEKPMLRALSPRLPRTPSTSGVALNANRVLPS